MQAPFYDPQKSYEANLEQGPFGAFADGQVFRRQGEPQAPFLGQRVFLPFGIPAGPLINGKFVKAALDKGFDLAVYKTVRTCERPCAPWPNVVAVDVDGDFIPERGEKGLIAGHGHGRGRDRPLAVANSFHVPSSDPDWWQQDMADAINYAKPGQVVIGSFQGTISVGGSVKDYIEDTATAAKLVKETGAQILEANLCCPSPGPSQSLCHDLEMALKAVEAVKNEIGDTPLIIKIPYFAQRAELAKLVTVLSPLFQGVSAINTIPSKVMDSHGESVWPGPGRTMGGVGGAPIKWAGLAMTEHLRILRDENSLDYTIIGVGGVTAPDDYRQYTSAGADAVMSASGAMWNPFLARECQSLGEK